MRKFKKLIKGLIIGFGLGISAFGMSSCSSTEKVAYSRDFTVVRVDYDTEADKTKITWTATLYNPSIYDLKDFSFKFDLYNGDTLVRTTDYVRYSIPIKHGATNSGSRYFIAEGSITDAKYVAWIGTFANVWETYFPWFVSTLAIAPTLALIVIIIIIVKGLDLSELGEFIGEHFWTLGIFAFAFLPYVIDGFVSGTWSFVPPLIVGGGIVAAVLLILLAFLVMFLVETINFSRGDKIEKPELHRDSKNKPYLLFEGDKKRYYIKDLRDDYRALEFFPKADLFAYCTEEVDEFLDESTSKKRLIDLVADSTPKEEPSEEKEGKKTNKRKPKSSITFNDIAGLEQAKQAFKEKVVLPFEHPDLFERFGKKAGGGILLYGLPGTGKTMFAEAAANEADALFIPIKCSDIKSKWYGESEKKVKEIFQKARKAKKAILFFDEFEAIGAKRTDDDNNGNNDLVPQILAEMQGVGTSSNDATIVVIAATNKPWSIDSAFMRPGRFDEKIYIPLPDYEARRRLFELQLSKLPISKDMDFDYLAKITEGFNGADIKEVCEKLKMSAIRDSLASNEEQEIGMEDVHRIEKTIQSSVSAEDVSRLEEFEEETR